MACKSNLESLEQANAWLTRRLHCAEEQVREGEEVNITLTDENRFLKEAKVDLASRLDELTTELDHLRSVAQTNSEDRQALKATIENLREKIQEYKADEEAAVINADNLKCEVEKAQDIITSYCMKLDDMTSYVAELELKYEHQMASHESELQQSSQAVELKEREIFELRRQISDLESSNLSFCKNFNGGESSDFIFGNKNDDSNTAGPNDTTATDKLVADLRKQVLDKSNFVQELEMRLECVQIAHQIDKEEQVSASGSPRMSDMSSESFYTESPCPVCVDGESQTIPSSSLCLRSDCRNTVGLVSSATQTESDDVDRNELLQQILSRSDDESRLSSFIEMLSRPIDMIDVSCQTDMSDSVSPDSMPAEKTEPEPPSSCTVCHASHTDKQTPAVTNQFTNTEDLYELETGGHLQGTKLISCDAFTQYDVTLAPAIQAADKKEPFEFGSSTFAVNVSTRVETSHHYFSWLAYQSDAISECYILPGLEPSHDVATQTDEVEGVIVGIGRDIDTSVKNLKLALQDACEGVDQINGLISSSSFSQNRDNSSTLLLADISSSDESQDSHLSLTCYPRPGKIRRVDTDARKLVSEQTSRMQVVQPGVPRPIVSVAYTVAVAVPFLLLYALLFFVAFSGSGLNVRYILQRIGDSRFRMPPH